MFNWQGISEFIAVVETKSFTLAAKRLELSTAQVSRQINQLEQRLELKLFYRTTRQVTVTEPGQLYYRQCKPLLEGLEQAQLQLTNLQQNPSGRFKVTAPVTFGELMLTPAVARFAKRYPKVQIELDLTNRQLDLVEEGVDLAIRLGHLGDSSMIAKRLASRRLYVCAAPSYIAAYGQPHSLSELSKHNCLIGSVEQWRFIERGQERSIRVKGSLRCNSGIALLEAALAGVGLVQLPDYYVDEHLASGALQEVLAQQRQADDGIYAVYPHNRQLSPKVRLFIEELQRTLNGESQQSVGSG
ncbi:LysR substrate-binding domain-containing protein [Ferrimonas senticii]|uniref:LysR substrate-binding domain-containing protein n=1 Tax=Ferrimonas senticii TaxID=394566 RepID=UPI0003FD1E4B|nr:LysR substrate-binding domain-containing protein [Ferrimonas senticii]